MRARPTKSALWTVFALVAFTACGGGDDATPDDEPDSSEPAATEGAQAIDDDTESADADTETDGSSGGDLGCDDVFEAAEMDEWFGEPTEMVADTTDSIGQLVCTWQTIEDPEDLDDLAASIVTAQVFSGDPVPAENFIDPGIFEEVTMLEGLGDVAFFTEAVGQGFYFFDDPVAGTLTFADINLGDADAPALHTPDELEELFRERLRISPERFCLLWAELEIGFIGRVMCATFKRCGRLKNVDRSESRGEVCESAGILTYKRWVFIERRGWGNVPIGRILGRE